MKKTIHHHFGKMLAALVLCTGLAATGCYDDSAIKEILQDHEGRISALETLCAQLNTNVASLHTIIEALDANDSVTGVAPIMEGNKTIGYTLTFKKGGSVTIYTANNTEFKIEDGFWYVSYDNGESWEKVGEATPGADDNFITNIEVNAQYLSITLSDGKTVIKVPLVNIPPAMTVNQGYKTIRFRGKASPTSVDYTVGIYIADSEEFLYNKIIDERSFKAEFFDTDGTFELCMHSNVHGYEDFGSFEEGITKYYRTFVRVNGVYSYSDMMTFTLDYNSAEVVSKVEEITTSSAKVSGHISLEYQDDVTAFLLIYEMDQDGYTDWETEKEIPLTLDSENNFTVSLSDLKLGKKYRYYICVDFGTEYCDDEYEAVFSFETKGLYDAESDLDVSQATDLSSSASANCYIISDTGLYKFKAVKGNSSESVGTVAYASILWETFGTDTAPEMFDLISAFCYKDGYIVFQAAETFKEGNAVIAAKDASGNILWSWHIWLTDKPEEQVYYNNAGTMMDRNLGATSATPGDVGTLGLLYQWGRKDPFLGSSSISSSTPASSTINWPSIVSSDSKYGTIEYATANPTTYIIYNGLNNDWHYTGSTSTEDTRWTTSETAKSIYDPCPTGWRVPDGGNNGVWAKALGSSSSYEGTYDNINEGVNFSGKFGNDQTIWYPASGNRGNYDGIIHNVGHDGYYWSASPYDFNAYYMFVYHAGKVYPSTLTYRALGYSVRCIQE